MDNEYLEAVKGNDLESVERLLCRESYEFDINEQDEEGRTPLVVAIETGYYELMQLLLEHKVNIGDGLLYAIQIQSTRAVAIICQATTTRDEESKETNNEVINRFAETEDFPSYMTPILLAATLNQYYILKILLDHGAKMPALNDVLHRVSDETHEQANVRHAWHYAHASDAYILLSSKDPIQIAFDMAKRLKQLGTKYPQHKDEYEQLSFNLEEFVTTLLEYVRNGEEIETVLWAGEEDDNEELPLRVRQALKLDLKKFIAHPNCQEYSLTRWYYGNTKWRDMSSPMFWICSLLVGLFYPIISVVYILLPWDRFTRLIKTPYVRFLLHTASRWTFLCILVCITLSDIAISGDDWSYSGNQMSLEDHYIHYAGPPLSILDILLYVWVVGMTWREFQECRRSGIREYFGNEWNWVDLFQLTFYWLSFGYHLKAHFVAVEYANEHFMEETRDYESVFQVDNETYLYPMEETRDYESVFQVDNETYLYPIAPPAPPGPPGGPPFLPDEPGLPGAPPADIVAPVPIEDITVVDFGNESRYVWEWNHPLLVAEATFSVASVLTCMSILRSLVILEFAGPLEIALAGMFGNIARFMVLFCVIWLSFGMGLTHLYQSFETLKKSDAEEGNVAPICWFLPCTEDDVNLKFDSLWRSLGTLFWSIFNMVDLEDLKIPEGYLYLTEITGLLLYAVFMVVAVIVMLNMLIAMMSDTYTDVQQNALTEWKVARTRLVNEYSTESATLPPPFNVIPSLKKIWQCYKWMRDFFEENEPHYGKRKKVQRLSQSLSVQRYKAVVEALVKRHTLNRRLTKAKEIQQGRLHRAVSELQKEVVTIRKNVNETRTFFLQELSTLKTHLNIKASSEEHTETLM